MGLKVAISTAVIMVSLLVVFVSWLMSAQPREAGAGTRDRSKIACTLDAAQRGDRRQRFASLRASAREVTELDNGYALRFDLDEATYRESTNLIFDEAQCCSFFEFRLSVLPSQHSLSVEITGPEGTKEFLAANVGFDSAESKQVAKPIGDAQSPPCACQFVGHCEPATDSAGQGHSQHIP